MIVCDEIRTEGSGKEILIGVYGEHILVSHFPATLGKLTFRVVTRVSALGLREFRFSVTPTKTVNPKIEIQGDLPDYSAETSMVLAFVAPAVVFSDPDRFDIKIGFGSEKPKLIDFFLVREPGNEEEAKRVPPKQRPAANTPSIPATPET